MVRILGDYKKVLVILFILAISLLQFDALTGKLGNELLHSELYFFSILLAGFWFGLKGGLIAALISSAICTFHFIIFDAFGGIYMALIVQILVFLAVGLFLGWMVDRREQSRKEKDLIQTKLMEERLQQQAIQIELETATKIRSLLNNTSNRSKRKWIWFTPRQ